MQTRPADPSELEQINAFIRKSKSYWGYTEAFLDAFMEKWRVKLKGAFLENELIFLEQDKQPVGLFAFKINEQDLPELDLFFIDFNRIGQGIGKAMWQQVLNFAKKRGWEKFLLISDPNAEGFYIKMGAKTISRFESFPGRFVPVMQVENP